MKKFMKPQLTIIITFALCIVSCSKKDDTPQSPDSKTLLTAKTWSAIKLGSDENANGKIDDNELKPLPANTTYYFTFMADGTVAAKVSDGKSTTNIVYSWELTDALTLKVANPAIKATFYWHIKTLTADQFNFEEYDANNTLTTGAQCIHQ